MLVIPLLAGITFVVFSITKALPGDPAVNLTGERSDAAAIEKIRRQLGTDRSIISQYAGYCGRLLHGDLGRSFYTNRSVSEDLKTKFPNTLRLAAAAICIAMPLGVLLGFAAALNRGKGTDRFISSAAVMASSMPVFWSGLLLMLLLSLRLKMVPPSGAGGLRYLLLPAVTLSLPALAVLVRVTRLSVINLLDMPYIRTAYAKGIDAARINTVHILKNALIPIVTVAGLEFSSYLNGAVLTETIFNWDGIGRYAMEGIIKRDYPVIMGCLLAGTTVFVFINLAVDLLYHFMDPRVRLHGPDR